MRLRKIMMAGAGTALLLASPASAAMDVATFVTKATALQAKGFRALFSPDLKLLKGESASVVAQMKQDAAARRAAGKPPLLYCPPAGAREMSANEMIAALSAIPPAERHISLKDGFVRVLARKYPCR